MVKQNQMDKFEKKLQDFWTFMKKNNPEDKLILNKSWHKYNNSNKNTYLENVLKRLDPHIDLITKNDEYVFSPEYSMKPRVYVLDYDILKFWKKNPSNDLKSIVFRYLQLLYIHGSLALDKNETKVKLIVETIKTNNDIAKEAKDNPNVFDTEDGLGGGMDLKSLFGDDTVLMDIASNITNEVNIQDILKEVMDCGGLQGNNSMETAAKLAQNPKIQNVIKNLQNSVGSKLRDKNVTNEDIMKSMDTLKTNLTKNIGNIPGGSQIKKMLKNLNVDQLMNNFNVGGDQNMSNVMNDLMANLNNSGNNDMSNMMNQMMHDMSSNPANPNLINNMLSNPNVMNDMIKNIIGNKEDIPIVKEEELD